LGLDSDLDDWIHHSRCKVCCIPANVDGYLDFRATMRSMVGYYPIARIYREVEGFFPRWPSRIRFSDESLRNHVNQHLTGRYHAMREIRILEARKDHGASLEDIQENFFSPMANLRQITEAMMQQFHEGNMGRVTWKDLIRANAAMVELQHEGDLQARFAVIVAQGALLQQWVIDHLDEKQKQELLDYLDLIDDPQKLQTTVLDVQPVKSRAQPALPRRRAKKPDEED